jgi:fibrillarin-like pre-rRNA processing protein
VNQDGVEYRLWDPTRSKLGAAIKKGVSQIGIKPGSTVLYLGCSTGTTVSHVSDIVGEEGKVFAVDLAPRVLRELLFVAQTRKNIYPILANAFLVQSFMHLVPVVDVIFMDVSQQNQAQIFLKNCAVFLKKGGFGLLALKSRSVDISQPPREIYAQTRTALEAELSIVDYRELDPFERDHAFFVCKKA